jgi:hypothetical protein
MKISTAGGHAITAVGDVQDETGIIAILDRLEKYQCEVFCNA